MTLFDNIMNGFSKTIVENPGLLYYIVFLVFFFWLIIWALLNTDFFY
jgi:hypothetical protein